MVGINELHRCIGRETKKSRIYYSLLHRYQIAKREAQEGERRALQKAKAAR